MINTSQGPKSPAEALKIFTIAILPQGSLLGIFNQLEGYPEYYEEALKHVLANPASYNDKLQRIAKEKSTGRPIGPKVINDINDLRKVLNACGLRAQVTITVKKEQARRLRTLLFLNNLKIDEYDKIGLTMVAMSGVWSLVPRTFTATLSLTSDDTLLDTERTLFGVVEKIELVSTLVERVKAYQAPVPLSDEIKATLAANPNVFYDRFLFLEVCKERVFPNQQKCVNELTESATMEDMLTLFHTNSSREDFLECYIVRFMEALD
jgi:hypothetical protein